MAKLIGSAPNQISTNGDLGSMAFEDKKNYATTSSPIYQPFRNIIINGDMSIAQRGTTATGLGNGDLGYHTVDRFLFVEEGSPTFEFTMSQDTDVPTGQGFAKSLKMDCTTAQGSLASGDQLRIEQRFEGQNLQYLKKGTSSAESLTLSFWVKSNKTGTYIIELFDTNNTRQISQSYTINTADTWEKKTLTFAGDTTGAFNNNNALSLVLSIWLGVGSTYSSGTLSTTWTSNTNANRAVGQVNLADSTSNYINITGVQLEAGTTASDFEFLPYDVNLTRCYRYYRTIVPLNTDNRGFSPGFYTANDNGRFIFPLDNPMRAIPTLDSTSGTDYFRIFSAGGSDSINSFSIMSDNCTNRFIIANNTTEASGIGGQAAYVLSSNNNAYLALEAEL
jgi:hypothetical protein